ncbi:glycoside hydrolase family 15 protein [Prolixibacteraceae bacterium JC049]|nr:glycoside hydrolase family 15 protein [Prolixibacteraceae bacterium JC049]
MKNLNYGIVGNCKSAALISDKGALEWFCLPQFDASSVFAKLLDREKGGSFELDVHNLKSTKQYYLPKTNILCTQYETEDGSFELLDFMPRYKTEEHDYYCPPDLIRYFRPLSGTPKFTIKYNPQLEYAQYETESVVQDEYIKSFTIQGNYDSLYLYSSFNLYDIVEERTITLTSDQYCLVSYNQKLLHQNIERSYLKLQRTKVYWLNWSEKTTRFMHYNEQVTRSALVLKLLSNQKSGAVLAALTTSLPETIGEVRNWDYRFCWIRDASMVVKIMNAIGHHNVAHRYLKFIIDVMPDKDEKMQIMYGINGEKKLTESTLDHLAGYEGSKPVRIGNAAYIQKQNDIYGILLDVIYQNFKLFNTGLAFSEDLWTIVRNVVTVVEKNWTEPDRGIWEIRGEARHFTFSKILCWVAIDRAVRIAKLLKQDQYLYSWSILCDTIKKDIIENAWSEDKQAFTQAYDTEHLDASVLLMESYGFLPAHDSRYRSTVLAIQNELEHKGLMYRYKNNDDFGLPKSSFTICTFWLINSLYKIGKKKEAKAKFDELLTYSNHLGLFSEDLDFETKRMLGNFPQAYSHLALIETAMNISDQEITDDDKVLEFIH